MDAYDFYGIDLTLDGELSYFTNDKAIIDEASRLHIEPKASFGYQEYAWSFLSEFSLLHTEYNQHGDLTGTDFDERVTRTMPKVRLYSQLNFERETAFFFKDGIQTLEPQIQYLYTPNKDQSNIGLYDTAKLQDDFFGLFRTVVSQVSTVLPLQTNSHWVPQLAYSVMKTKKCLILVPAKYFI